MEIPIYHLWYNVIDNIKVNQFKNYEDENPFFTVCFYVGGAGVGKSACITKFATVKRVHFVTPTNFAGTSLYSSLRNKTVYIRASPTIFNLLNEKYPNDDNINTNIYRNKLDEDAKNGNVSSLYELWCKLEPAFKSITDRRHKNIFEKRKLLTPSQLVEIKNEALKYRWLTNNPETELEEILDYIRSTKIAPISSIPIELTYDTLIIDEAGRVPLLDVLRLAYDYGVMRAKYGYPRKIKFILEGSCTQQTVINKTGLAINNYSALTVISAPFFEKVPFFARLSTHNRRCSGGDPYKTAIWFNFVDKLEKGQFIPPSLKKKFFEVFGVKHQSFKPTKEEIEADPSLLQSVYLSTDHATLKEVTAQLESYMDKVNVTEWFASTEKDACQMVPFILQPEKTLGSGYKSVLYNNKQWLRTEPLEELSNQVVKEYRYINERTLFVDGVYTLTHRARVTLIQIDAKLEDFFKDYYFLRPYMTEECVSSITTKMVEYLTVTMKSLIQTYCSQHVISQLENIEFVWERIRNDSESVQEQQEADDDDNDKTTNKSNLAIVKLESEILSIMRAVACAVPDTVLFRQFIDLDFCANIILYKGYDLILNRVKKNILYVKLGKSFIAAMFKKPVKLMDTSILNFNRCNQSQSSRKRPRNDDDDNTSVHRRPSKRLKRTRSFDENAAAIMEMIKDRVIDNEGCEEDDENVIIGKTKGVVVTARIFPIRSTLTLTIASSQSRTFSFNHIVNWSSTERIKRISAEDVIVSATRLSDTSQFRVYVKDPDIWVYSPLSIQTKKAMDIYRKVQSKTGYLL